MKKIFDKQLLGIEDIEIGSQPIQQTRNGEVVEVEPISALYDAGLLKDLDRDAIPVGVEYLWFKGFYEEGDDGQGIYALVPEDAYYYSEREDDTGLYIKANGRLYEREGSWNKFPENTGTPALRGEKRHFIMIEWYGGRHDDSSYNNFWILEKAYKTIYIKTIEMKANKHYYFKQYTDITISRTSSLEIRGNNAYMHFDIFSGTFHWEIPTILEYIILRDINYASIVPEFSFDGSKCRYFNIYHNSNIHQPTGKGYVYKKDSQELTGEVNVTSLPKISKINYDENAVVNKAYVDSLYELPDNLVEYSDNIEISAFKQVAIDLKRNINFSDLDDDDLVTQAELYKWLLDNINSMINLDEYVSIIPIGFEYLQFKPNVKVFSVSNSLYHILDINGTYYSYVDGSRLQVTLEQTIDKYSCYYELDARVYIFKDAILQKEIKIFYESEEPSNIFGGSWRLNKEENDIKYWEKV